MQPSAFDVTRRRRSWAEWGSGWPDGPSTIRFSAIIQLENGGGNRAPDCKGSRPLRMSAGRALYCCGSADPFFVTVYGRTYKVDPGHPSDQLKGKKPQEAMKALPADIAEGPGFRPSHEQTLAEVEERAWIAPTSSRTNWKKFFLPPRAVCRNSCDRGRARDYGIPGKRSSTGP